MNAAKGLSWKERLLIAAFFLAWPAVIAPHLWRARRFWLLEQRARGWKYELAAEGIEVWRGDEPARLLPWDAVQAGQWLAHAFPTFASGDEASYGVEFPGEGVALVEGPGAQGALQPLLKALGERGAPPEIADGGRALGAGGWMMSFTWVGCATLLVLLAMASCS